MEQPCPACGGPMHSGPCVYTVVISADDWNQASSPIDDLRELAQRIEQQAREPLRPFVPDPGLAWLAAAFAAEHGLSPPPDSILERAIVTGLRGRELADELNASMRDEQRELDPSVELEQLVASFRDGRPREPGPSGLDPLLEWAIGRGIMTEGQARDVDAFADGIVAREREGEITEAECLELTARQAIADATAELRARERAGGNRAARRAQRAQQRQQRKPKS